MRYIIEIDENKKSFAEEFFKNVSFIKKVQEIPSNEITNPAILKSIEDYESSDVKPTRLSLEELKQMLHA